MFLFTSRGPGEAQAPAKTAAVPFAAPLKRAAEATGVSFDYLAKTAERESRFDPKAKAGTSSATGMFQFLDQTWLGMIKQDGARLGFAQEAAAITGDGGRFSVQDPATRQKILGLREDPQVAAMMAGAFAARNGQQLEQAIGRKPNDGELYMAHFLGAAGARELIQLVQSNPDASAASSFREAASANRSVFFDKSGRARSAREVHANLSASFNQAQPPMVAQTAATTDAAHAMFRVKDGGKPLHGLFRSNGEPVASAVADTWARMGRRPPVAAGAETRVAYFPRDGVGARTATDAVPSILPAEAGRGQIAVTLPPKRPQEFEAAVAQPVRKRQAQATPQPLNLMQFMKPGQR